MTTAHEQERIDPRDAALAAEIRADISRQRKKQAQIAVEIFGRPPQWLSRRLNGEVPLTPAEMLTLGDHLDVNVIKWLTAISPGPGTGTGSVTDEATSIGTGQYLLGNLAIVPDDIGTIKDISPRSGLLTLIAS